MVVKVEVKKDVVKKVENIVQGKEKTEKIEPKVEPVSAKQEELIAPAS